MKSSKEGSDFKRKKERSHFLSPPAAKQSHNTKMEEYVNGALELVFISEERGRGYRAKEPIKAGSLLMRTQPCAALFHNEVDHFLAYAQHQAPSPSSSAVSKLLQDFEPSKLAQVCHGLLVHRLMVKELSSESSYHLGEIDHLYE